jgi:hypothetical protein
MHRTLVHGLAAAAITALAFGIGPGIGWAVGTMDVEYDLVQGPLMGERDGTMDFASFELQLAPQAVDVAEADGPEVMEEVEPVEVAQQSIDKVDDRAPPREVQPERPQPAQATVASTPEAKAAKGRRCEVEEKNPKIARTGKGDFIVERSLVTYYISHINALNSLGWSSRNKGPDGSANGMKIGGVRCGNDLHLAGIRSGDVVHRVNGRDITSIPQAIFVYQKVRKDPVIEVELTRRGKLHVLRYQFT